MRAFPLLLLSIAAGSSAQSIRADRYGKGYEVTISAREGTAVSLEHLLLRAVPLGLALARWQDRPTETDGVGAGVRIGRASGTVTFSASGTVSLFMTEWPRELLGAQGLRLTVAGSRFGLPSRLLTPVVATLPPRLAPGMELMGLLADSAPWLELPDGSPVPLGQRAFRRIKLTEPEGDGWKADLDGVGPVRIVSNPLLARGLVSLSPEPGAWRYVGREFWAYPNSIEALSASGRARGTAILQGRRVRVKSLSRFWSGGEVILSGSLAPTGGEMGIAGLWPALHPLIVVVEPVDAKPIPISLARPSLASIPTSVDELVEFVRKAEGRHYFLAVADLWHLDRMLSPVPPSASLRGASAEIRRAVGMARPIPGMTPAQVAWAIGWPNDPMPRSELERIQNGRWEYPTPYGWNSATFKAGKLVRYVSGLSR